MRLSIRWKIALLAAAVLCCVMVVLAGVLVAVVRPGFEEIEKELAAERMRSVLGMIQSDKAALDSLVIDWAAWDDTYDFVKSGNEDYISSNLIDDTFLNNRTELFVITDLEGKMLWSRLFDQDWLPSEAYPDFLNGRLLAGDPIFASVEEVDTVSGLRDTPQGPMLISAFPVTDSAVELEPLGILIMGRRLDKIVADRVEPYTRYPVILSHVTDTPFDQTAEDNQRRSTPLVIGHLEEDKLVDASILLGDMQNEAIARLSLQVPMNLDFQSTKTILLAVQTAGAGGLVVIIVFWLAARGLVLRPLENLQRHIRHVTETGDMEHFQKHIGNDEIGTVAKAFSDMQGRVSKLAHYDVLTNLANRTLFKVLGTQALSRSRREGTKAAVLILDIDRFKTVNDSLGHGTGDEMLRQIAARLESQCHGDDLVARIGGDEFALLIRGLNDVVDAQDAASRLLTAFDAPYAVGEKSLFVTVSVGISLYPDDTEELDTLIRNADSAMYHAKSLGRNNFQFFDQKMNERSRELLSMETSLREALLNDKLQVLYQPQVDIETGEMVGVETLARWQHPTRGLIGAGNFLPFAEQSGLHAALDRTILTAACRQLVTWQSMSLPAFPVSVNICAKNFDTGDLHAMVTQVLDQTGADPNLLALEITESHVAREGTATVRTLEALRNMGIRIVIDDFGTGFASLSYLRKFPVDEVKIDKSFVQELPNNRSDGAIVRAVLALADELELKVIGEGVERQEQLQWLRSHGLRVVQGYLTGEPLSPIQIIQRVMHAETDPPKPHELSSERIEEPVTSGYDFSTGSFARRAPST